MNLTRCGREYAAPILDILNEAIQSSTALYDYRPRTLTMMDSWFEGKEKDEYPVIGMVDDAGRLLGFTSYGTFRAWPAYKYTVEHSIYVEKNSRGHGIGGKLLGAVIKAAGEQGFHNLIGGIDAENATSIALHRRYGFEHCGIIRHAGFKFGRWLDLAFYQRILPTPTQPADG